MQRNKTTTFLGLGGIILCAVLSLGTTTAQADGISTKIRTGCTTCHSLDRICKNLRVKSKEGWTTTVQRMLNRKPVLQGEDVGHAIDYLATLPAGSPDICR
ncbi:hypothetical protein N1030_06870 [Desulfovibrio mangrovi]|uniref:hypothetical protein n=1 Tax=Desulfovibrio mangrovi TaxID=2976983 RepID=UPI0022479786|nr:hypothetical protein [Desulfovibrio mangrovi]UZP68685.1 hypothetical protein N1030_06870 [Desulfovibrio mangrovi]